MNGLNMLPTGVKSSLAKLRFDPLPDKCLSKCLILSLVHPLKQIIGLFHNGLISLISTYVHLSAN